MWQSHAFPHCQAHLLKKIVLRPCIVFQPGGHAASTPVAEPRSCPYRTGRTKENAQAHGQATESAIPDRGNPERRVCVRVPSALSSEVAWGSGKMPPAGVSRSASEMNLHTHT